MGPHDVARIENEGAEVRVHCACGASYVASTQAGALDRHAQHFYIEQARLALRGGNP